MNLFDESKRLENKALTFERGKGMTNYENNEMKESSANVPEHLLKITIGKITYLIGVHFSEDSNETMADKIDCMIRRDIQTGTYR